MSLPRVLLVSPDAVGERMAGLGIRYTELARALAPDAEVVLATGDDVGKGGAPDGVRLVRYSPHAPSALRPEIIAADTVVAPPQWPLVTRWMRRSGARIVFDLYDPETLETLELFSDRHAAVRRLMVSLTLDRLEDAFLTGHHFMCAGEAQRDLWIGALLGSRLLGPSAYDHDPSLRAFLDRVPVGVPDRPPQATGPGVREAFEQIAEGDEVILWNGGIWRWLDAPTAIRAVGRLAERRPAIRLVFMGAGSGVAGRAAAGEARELSRRWGLLGDTVLFNDGWVPYGQRASWLLQADCAVATGVDHLETRFAFRTRLLDCFWAGLPVVCTAGDELAERVTDDGLGATVAPGDAEALAEAIEGVLDRGRPAYAEALGRAASEHAWTVVAEPLRRWIASDDLPPRLAGDALSRRRRAGHRARSLTYRAVRRALEAARLDWPSP